MASLPLALAVPAAAAGLAYLNAKYSISYDWHMFREIKRSMNLVADLEAAGRLNTFYVLEEKAKDPYFADRPCLLFEGRTWTFKQSYDTALRYGTWLKQTHGISKGDVVAMDITNNDKFIWTWYGLLSLGAKPAFINYNLTGVSLTHCVKVSHSRLLLVDPDVQHNITDAVRKELDAASVTIIPLDVETVAKIESTVPVREPDSARGGQRASDMAMLIFTSGTTGLPKAAYVSWQKCQRAAAFPGNFMGLTPDDRFLTTMPLYHSAGSALCVGTAIHHGCLCILGRKFSARTYWDFVRETEATVIQYVGETCRYMLTAPPSPLDKQNKVRIAYGNGLRPDIWQEFKTRFDIPTVLEFYGATEGPVATYNLSRGDYSAGAIGRTGGLIRLLFGSASAIVKIDPETDAPARDATTGFCTRVDNTKNEAGEMLNELEARNVHESFQGYYNNKKATSGKVLRDVFKKGDAWYRTGDLMRATPDGLLYFNDRIGDTFRWKSENVSTNEVSEALGRHPAISEANVYGVALPRHDGRAGCAAVVLKQGTSIDNTLLSSLAAHNLAALPRYAVPVFLRFTDKLEATGTNKHMKHILRGEGADPEKVEKKGDKLYWLQPGKTETYVKFETADWSAINNGGVRL